jgi:VIT1/CCC1 family predicted Fe2+/Mn2+ transporter
MNERRYLYADLVTSDPQTHPAEPHVGAIGTKLNWLRAGVLGANDGIVSVAGIVVGVAAATVERSPIITAGVAGLVAGALSMALGEYVSVSTQRDTERALLDKERRELIEEPEAELEELVGMYRAKGLSPETARTVAVELTAHDAFAAHIDIELGIDPDELTNPWHAAISSAIAFTVGALLPLLAILLPPPSALWLEVHLTASALLLPRGGAPLAGNLAALLAAGASTDGLAALPRAVEAALRGLLVTISIEYLG